MPPSEKDGGETKEREQKVCEGGKYIQHTLCSATAGSSVLPDVSTIKTSRQARCCLADISVVAKTCPFDYNSRVDCVYWSATKEIASCVIYHMQTALSLSVGLTCVSSNWIKRTADVLFNLSFRRCLCHQAAVIPLLLSRIGLWTNLDNPYWTGFNKNV